MSTAKNPAVDQTINRRRFLRDVSLSAGAVAAGAAVFGTGLARAIEPLARTSPKFKFSLAAYSYRDLLTGKNASLTLSDFIDDCARFGLEGTELTSYYFPKSFDGAYLASLKQRCFVSGLDISGTAVGNDFGHPEGETRQAEIAKLKEWIRHANQLGAPVIRIFAGHAKPGLSEEASHRLMVSAIEECCDYAGKNGVFLALENHGGPTATAAGLMKFVRDVKSPWFGVNLDTGNFHSEDVYAEMAAVAPYALNVQVKVVTSGPDKKKVPADFRRLAKILREANYRGYIVLEYEEAGDARAESQKFLNQLREAFA